MNWNKTPLTIKREGKRVVHEKGSLPEKSGDYLVACFSGYNYTHHQIANFSAELGLWSVGNVVAWSEIIPFDSTHLHTPMPTPDELAEEKAKGEST